MPSTGERIILTDSVPIEMPGNTRSERAARKEAEKVRTKLLANAGALKVARTKATHHPRSAHYASQNPAEVTEVRSK